MPPLLVDYKKPICMSLASQEVELMDSLTIGNRVQVPISVDDLNAFFYWERTPFSPAPVGYFRSDISGVKFLDILIKSLSSVYTDLDGTTDGLNFSSYVLDANLDPRVRQDGKVTANDLVVAYILYKCYGFSACPTEGVVYNLQDMYNMLSSSGVARSIVDALESDSASGLNLINGMFKTMLSTNPMRFFQAHGGQKKGIFEKVYTGEVAYGPWEFVVNDRLEIHLRFRFTKEVSHTSVDMVGNDGTSYCGDGDDYCDGVSSRNIVIKPDSFFAIRLQLLAVPRSPRSTTPTWIPYPRPFPQVPQPTPTYPYAPAKGALLDYRKPAYKKLKFRKIGFSVKMRCLTDIYCNANTCKVKGCSGKCSHHSCSTPEPQCSATYCAISCRPRCTICRADTCNWA